MRGRPTAQAAFAILRAFVARWYANVLQVHTRSEVELDHGRGGAKSRAGCPPSESSGAKVVMKSIENYARIMGDSKKRIIGKLSLRNNLIIQLLFTEFLQCFNIII